VPLDMDLAQNYADAAADAANATEFGRPEDVEVIAEVLYVANTSENRLVAIDLERQVLSTFVHAGDNVRGPAVAVLQRPAPGQGARGRDLEGERSLSARHGSGAVRAARPAAVASRTPRRPVPVWDLRLWRSPSGPTVLGGKGEQRDCHAEI
jgi:hypothetical protein